MLLIGPPTASALLQVTGTFAAVRQIAPPDYSALHILLTPGFMALGRIRCPEGLRHIAPGEFGKVIGLDRVPEVRTLRQKTGQLAATGNAQAWMQDLGKSWMQGAPLEAGCLYVDGHVRVDDGCVANLPRRFVWRERLCLRGTTDYWVNDAIRRPFFVVSKAVTDGMGEALLKEHRAPAAGQRAPAAHTKRTRPRSLAAPFCHRV